LSESNFSEMPSATIATNSAKMSMPPTYHIPAHVHAVAIMRAHVQWRPMAAVHRKAGTTA
jgi:hypothetical protein